MKRPPFQHLLGVLAVAVAACRPTSNTGVGFGFRPSTADTFGGSVNVTSYEQPEVVSAASREVQGVNAEMSLTGGPTYSGADTSSGAQALAC